MVIDWLRDVPVLGKSLVPSVSFEWCCLRFPSLCIFSPKIVPPISPCLFVGLFAVADVSATRLQQVVGSGLCQLCHGRVLGSRLNVEGLLKCFVALVFVYELSLHYHVAVHLTSRRFVLADV